MISEIFLPEILSSQFDIAGVRTRLSGLNRINIFIGPNNSGKSRFMRGLFANPFTYRLREIDFKKYADLGRNLKASIDDIIREFNILEVSSAEISGIKKEIDQIEGRLSKDQLPDGLSAVKDLEAFISKLKTFKITETTRAMNAREIGTSEELGARIRLLAGTYSNQIDPQILKTSLPDFYKVYVPMLRGLRPVQIGSRSAFEFNLEPDNYKNRTIVDYFAPEPLTDSSFGNASQSLKIVSGLSFYNEVRDMLLGTIPQRERIRSFERFLGETFFDNEPFSLTPRTKEDCLYVTIGTWERPIFELGDGVQSIIVLLYSLYFHNDQNLVCFIEEPELSLHPGMQRLFIDTLMRKEFENVQIFLTTHSNHFLDMILDHRKISIFNFSQVLEKDILRFRVDNTQNEDIRLLDALGVRNSSIFMSNCTVWVEGITDRLYLNKYMEVLQMADLKGEYESGRLKEDLHYSYIEYGGSNIVHYSFDDEDNWEKIKASKISQRILLVVDEDGVTDKTSKKSERISELKRHLEDRLVVLPCREIENSISAKVLEAVLREWEKNEQLSLGTISELDYRDVYLGKFIEEKASGVTRKYAAARGSGTIRDKVAFCRAAIGQIKSTADLSPVAKDIAERVLKFIRSQNTH
jgi:hypothetical protein